MITGVMIQLATQARDHEIRIRKFCLVNRFGDYPPEGLIFRAVSLRTHRSARPDWTISSGGLSLTLEMYCLRRPEQYFQVSGSVDDLSLAGSQT